MIECGNMITCDRCKIKRFYPHDQYNYGWYKVSELGADLCSDCFDEWEACKEDFMEEGSNENNR